MDASHNFNVNVSGLPTSPKIKNGFNAHTQKFSKIQLQAIIDNLYQYESKQKQHSSVTNMNDQLREQMLQLNKTLNLQSINTQILNLPEVNHQSPDNIRKSNTLANITLNAIQAN